MLFTALATAALGRVVEKDTSFTDAEYWTLWQHFQSFKDHDGYGTMAEHNERFEIFKKNMDFAREFNSANDGEWTFELGVTIHADKTQEEFKDWLKLTSGTKPKAPAAGCDSFDASAVEAPAAKDWTSVGAVTPIKNQGQCGSCWAFSTTGSIEGQNFLTNGKLTSFSEEQLVDCSSAEGNQGCNGGLMDDGFAYVEEYGLCTELDYPYSAGGGRSGSCEASSCTASVHVDGCTDISQGDTDALMKACGTVGPISIAVDANTMWQLYSGGVFNHYCNKNSLDHGVLLVGYDSSSSNGYWKVKNSWGETWGEQGFIRLAGTDKNTCGLANSASYPHVVKK